MQHQEQPLLSIITPCLNAAETIKTTLDSVRSVYKYLLAKKLTIEHIVIEGNSRDGTIDIILDFMAIAPYLRFVHEEVPGIYRAMNRGLELASGEYTHILNADDHICRIETYCDLIQTAKLTNKKIILGSIIKIENKKGRELDTWIAEGKGWDEDSFRKKIMRGSHYPHPGFIAKTAIYKNEGFDETYSLSADYKLMQSILLNDARRSDILISEEALVAMRDGGATSTFSGILKGYKQISAINKELGIRSLLSTRYLNKLRRRGEHYFRKWALKLKLIIIKYLK
jgi:glycosyltransferase involved in cell wall biosynthesis